MTDTWEDEGGYQDTDQDDLEYFDWPYDDEADDELVKELMEEWANIDDVDDYKYVDGKED